MPTIEMLYFRGAIGETQFQDLAAPDFLSALHHAGWRQAPHGQIFESLRQRGSRVGIRTPNDLVRAIGRGRTTRQPDGTCLRSICGGRGALTYREEIAALIQLTLN